MCCNCAFFKSIGAHIVFYHKNIKAVLTHRFYTNRFRFCLFVRVCNFPFEIGIYCKSYGVFRQN